MGSPSVLDVATAGLLLELQEIVLLSGSKPSRHGEAYSSMDILILAISMPVSLPDLENALRTALPIEHLEITDQSSGCGENYAVLVVSEAFEGKMTLARHRLINELLKDQIAQMHAFSQKTLTPKQYAAQLEKEKAAAAEAENATSI